MGLLAIIASDTSIDHDHIDFHQRAGLTGWTGNVASTWRGSCIFLLKTFVGGVLLGGMLQTVSHKTEIVHDDVSRSLGGRGAR